MALICGVLVRAELRAIQRQQPPPSPEDFPMSGRLGQGSQTQTHQLAKNLPRQAAAPFRSTNCRTFNSSSKSCPKCSSQGAGAVHNMKNQTGKDFVYVPIAPEAGVPVAWANTAGSLRNVPGKAPQNRTKPQQPILLSIFFMPLSTLGGRTSVGGGS